MIRAGAVLFLPLIAIAQPAFEWKDNGSGGLELREHGKPALVYNYGPQYKAPAPQDRTRCCYIFPLYTPAGVSMLDDFPKDHWHHRGLFWAWPVVETEGNKYDIWMNFTIRPHTASPPRTSATAKEARLEAHNTWQIDGRDVVRETVVIHVLPAQSKSRELEAELTLEAIKGSVTLKGSNEPQKSYGGFSARFAEREGTVVRADGEALKKDEDLVPHQWAELEGVYGGKRATLRITSDAKNPGAPYQWCLRNYGFVGASFPGKTAEVDHYTLEPGKPVTMRFRVQVRDE
jgi:hypothetical protein